MDSNEVSRKNKRSKLGREGGSVERGVNANRLPFGTQVLSASFVGAGCCLLASVWFFLVIEKNLDGAGLLTFLKHCSSLGIPFLHIRGSCRRWRGAC